MNVILSLALAAALANADRACAEKPAAAFESANKLYEQGRYADAASAYQNILHSDGASPALYFNFGNALFKSGQIGRAIVAFRHAGQLTPRDPDVRANLQFARNQVQGPTLRSNRWERWLDTLSLNEWTWLGAGALWLTFLLLTAMQLWPSLKPALRNYTATAGGTAVILCSCFGCALAQRFVVNTAVVVAPDAVVRAGPLEESPNAFIAHDGAELRVVDRKDDWLQVRDGSQRVGWLKLAQTTLLDGS